MYLDYIDIESRDRKEKQDSILEGLELGAIDPATAFKTATSVFSIGKKLFGKKRHPNAQVYDEVRAEEELIAYIQSYYPPPKYEFVGRGNPNIKEQIKYIVRDAALHNGSSTYKNMIVRWVDEIVGPENFRHLFRDQEYQTQVQIELAELEKQTNLFQMELAKAQTKALENGHSSQTLDTQSSKLLHYGLAIGATILVLGTGSYLLIRNSGWDKRKEKGKSESKSK